MAACDKGDFDDWAQPQSNEQQPAVTVSGFTASSAGAVDLNTAGDSVKVINLSETQLPEGGTIDNAKPLYWHGIEVAITGGGGASHYLQIVFIK